MAWRYWTLGQWALWSDGAGRPQPLQRVQCHDEDDADICASIRAARGRRVATLHAVARPESTGRAAGDGIVPRAPVIGGLLAVAAGYYLGALLGFELRFPPATTSVLWPPNAILTAALLLVPPRRFWLVVLAALPAHFAAQLPAGIPLSLAAAFFGTNCAQALLAAGLVHLGSDEPARFDSLRRVLVFLAGAVLAAPIVTSFADAAAVHGLRGEAFGAVFIRRLFSNFLGQLVLVPSVVALVRLVRRWPRALPRRRLAELALITVAHLTVGGLVLSAYHGAFELPGGPFAALPLLMPLLVTAAIRFGPGGASLSLLATALLATCIAVSRATASGIVLAEERVLALQVFLIVAGAPLLCLSALMEERGRAAATLQQRLRFEELVSQISGAFVHVPSHRMREAIADALGRLGTFLELEGVALWSDEGAPPALPGADRNPRASAVDRLEERWRGGGLPARRQPLVGAHRSAGRAVAAPGGGRPGPGTARAGVRGGTGVARERPRGRAAGGGGLRQRAGPPEGGDAGQPDARRAGALPAAVHGRRAHDVHRARAEPAADRHPRERPGGAAAAGRRPPQRRAGARSTRCWTTSSRRTAAPAR